MKPDGSTMAEALDVAVRTVAHWQGTPQEYGTRVYLAVQVFISDYAWRTRKLHQGSDGGAP